MIDEFVRCILVSLAAMFGEEVASPVGASLRIPLCRLGREPGLTHTPVAPLT